MTPVEPGRREEHRVLERVRALQRRRGALDSAPEEAVERRLHAPALGVSQERLGEGERGEIHRHFLAEPFELRLIGEPPRGRIVKLAAAVLGYRKSREPWIEVVMRL